ncbi:MAG: biotin transporter BioY [Propionibacteriaceae bacterium]|nr:biotin transporter BioY [Propionibacteriaceae bacterium]
MRPKDLALIALFAALTAALGLTPVIPLPMIGVTFALQTLGMLLAGGVLGARRAAWSMLLLILLVAIGLPVLTGGQGGLGKLVGPTAGFIWSWPLGALLVGWLIEKWWTTLTFAKALTASLLGSVCLYILGQTWLAISLHIPLRTALWSWVIYLPGDIVKSILAAVVIVTVKRAYPLITPRPGTPASPSKQAR